MPWHPADLRPEQARRYYELVCDESPWGIAEVAAELGVAEATVRNWRSFGVMPEPELGRKYRPRWYAGTVRHWAMSTGRMDLEGGPVRRGPGWRPRPPQRGGREVAVDPAVTAALLADETPWSTTRVAAELEVRSPTVHTWRSRGLLPPPDVPEPGRNVWRAGTIRRWAMAAGRMAVDGTPLQAPLGRPPRRNRGRGQG